MTISNREFANLLGITPETLRVWEREGKIVDTMMKCFVIY
ncbi:TPA: MerR family transcriptional regulator [Candidatus Poribacteria bacterium]|nr:MerR family transcriptional regulator [Candidatus Poribacteria bacterium]